MDENCEIRLGNGLTEKRLSVREKGELLEKTQLGKDLEWHELPTLAEFFDVFRGDAGSYICRQGEQSGFLCIICQGRVDIVREDIEHHAKVIASLGPGNSLGEMSLIDGESRSASALIHTPVVLLVMMHDRFDQLMEEYPRLWGKIVRRIASVLSKRLRRTSGILAEYLES